MHTLSPVKRLAASLAVVLSPLAAPAGAEALSPEIEWDTKIEHFQFDQDKFIGQRLSLSCPPLDVRTKIGDAYGTDVYPSNSPLCVAALHAGVMDREGGDFTVQLNPGAEGYTGSERFGVRTASLPATPRSIAFLGGNADDLNTSVYQEYLPRIKWDTKFTATGFANLKLKGQKFSFLCPAAPADMRARRIVGTDRYAFPSMVCRAAVHAGEITTAGGVVTVQMLPGEKKLVGSIRNGIETKDGSGGHTTIAFVSN